jgi:hypothetical protein
MSNPRHDGTLAEVLQRLRAFADSTVPHALPITTRQQATIILREFQDAANTMKCAATSCQPCQCLEIHARLLLASLPPPWPCSGAELRVKIKVDARVSFANMMPTLAARFTH